MVNPETLHMALKNIFMDELPGFNAQSDMMPEGRIKLPDTSSLQNASVLIAFFPREADWYFPLFRRVADGFAHSGQVSLPGGRAEENEKGVETALREAWEEVGIEQQEVSVCGQLSSLPIPVSEYVVHPFLGVLENEPEWRIEDREVDELLIITVSDFLKKDSIQAEQRIFQGQTWTIPYFHLADHKVWGATAMILSELRAMLFKLEPDILKSL